MKETEPCGDLHHLFVPCKTMTENASIVCTPSEVEIKMVVWDLHPLKSPGPDGFLGIFFRCYWGIIKEQIVQFVQDCFNSRSMAKGVNKIFLVLIPKVQHAVTFTQFRPISLCNFLYKIVSKILTNRLGPFLSRIISPNQGAFVEGRWITENTVIAHKVVQKVRKHKGMNGLMVVKIYLQKTYDYLELGLVESVLTA